MLSVAGGVIDRSVRHSAFRILPTVLQPTSADFIPQITFRIPHFLKLPIPKIVISLVVTDMANKLLSLSLSLSLHNHYWSGVFSLFDHMLKKKKKTVFVGGSMICS